MRTRDRPVGRKAIPFVQYENLTLNKAITDHLFINYQTKETSYV